MTGQEEPPGFEELEPEGKDDERYPRLENGNGQGFETLAVDDSPMETRGGDDLEEDEAFTSLDQGLELLADQPPRRPVASGSPTSFRFGEPVTGRPHGGRAGEGPAGSAALREDDELMSALATAAALAESRAEAERLVVALVPLSLRLVPVVSRTLWPALPALIEGAAGLTRLLHAHPATRPLIAEIPALLRRTTWRLAGYALDGRPISSRLATRVLNHHAAALLSQARPRTGTTRRRRTRVSHHDAPWPWGAY